jgi:thiol-disulfide isomerase/thioredoxin
MRPAPQPDDEPRRQSSNKVFYIVALLGALGAAAWIGPSFVSASTAPDFTLYPSDGDPAITLSQYRGKVVVLDFWASWCPPCKAAIPAMERLHQANRGRGVKVMGINMSDNVDPEQFLKSMKVTYTNLANGDDVGKEYGVKGIPTLVVIGKDGSVALKHSGWAPQFEQQIQDAIDAELAK